MSLELDEKDVKRVASRRFWDRRTRKVIILYLLLLAISLGMTWIPRPWDFSALLPMLVAVVWFIHLCLGEEKAKKELVKKWKEETDDTDS